MLLKNKKAFLYKEKRKKSLVLFLTLLYLLRKAESCKQEHARDLSARTIWMQGAPPSLKLSAIFANR